MVKKIEINNNNGKIHFPKINFYGTSDVFDESLALRKLLYDSIK